LQVFELLGNDATCLAEHAGDMARHISECLGAVPSDFPETLAQRHTA